MNISAGLGAFDLFGVGEQLLLAALVKGSIFGLGRTAGDAVSMRTKILAAAACAAPIEFDVTFDFACHAVS
jgi:hypothetical protein